MKTAVILSARKDKDTEIPFPLKLYHENVCLIDRTIEALTALNYTNIILVVGSQAQMYKRYASKTVRLVLNSEYKFMKQLKKVLEDYCKGKEINIKIVMLREFARDLGIVIELYQPPIFS